MTEKITSIIRDKFIENLDEGLMLRTDLQSFNLTKEEEEYFGHVGRSSYSGGVSREELSIPDKQNPLVYLTTIFLKIGTITLKDQYDRDISESIYFDHRFRKHYNWYWTEKAKVLVSILSNASQYISAESFSEKDLVFVNVGYRDWAWENKSYYNEKILNNYTVLNNGKKSTFVKKADCKKIVETYVDIFIITDKYFIKLSLGPSGVIDRTEHIIQRDVKKVNIAENIMLEVYFHGHFDPETIVLDDYKSALQLQRHLTELRQVRPSNNNHSGQNRK
jgi:hypothetical protein